MVGTNVAAFIAVTCSWTLASGSLKIAFFTYLPTELAASVQPGAVLVAAPRLPAATQGKSRAL